MDIILNEEELEGIIYFVKWFQNLTKKQQDIIIKEYKNEKRTRILRRVYNG
jgi:phenolic acid decarboxylase